MVTGRRNVQTPLTKCAPTKATEARETGDVTVMIDDAISQATSTSQGRKRLRLTTEDKIVQARQGSEMAQSVRMPRRLKDEGRRSHEWMTTHEDQGMIQDGRSTGEPARETRDS